MAGVKRMLPLQSVVSQLNTFIADGTAISRVSNTNTDPRNGFNPLTNMWCAQTRKASTVMAKSEPIMAMYPNMGLRELTDMTSETSPIAGIMTIYTSG